MRKRKHRYPQNASGDFHRVTVDVRVISLLGKAGSQSVLHNWLIVVDVIHLLECGLH